MDVKPRRINCLILAWSLSLVGPMAVAQTADAPLAHARPAALALDWSSPADALAADALGKQRGVAEVGVWQGGQARYGMARQRVADAPAQALFEVGSISKVFTGLLLAQAVERGDLSLATTVGALLKNEPGMAALPAPVAAITLGQLVTHTSCLARLPPDFYDRGYQALNPYIRYDRARLWATLAQARLAQSPPCEGAYSNWGFGLLGELLALHYGQPWAALVRERITAPLAMHDTVQTLGDKAQRLATPYDGEQPVSVWDFDALAGAGALRSTVADMLVFSRALMAGAQGPLGAAAQRLFTPLAEHEGAPIGYAVMLRERDGLRTWLHTGVTGGFRTVWMLAPERGDAVIVVASSAQAAQNRMYNQLLQARYPNPQGRAATAADDVQRYTGVYRLTPQLIASLAVIRGQLHLRGSGGRYEPLHMLGDAPSNRFLEPQQGRVLRVDAAGLHEERYGARKQAPRVDEPLLGQEPPQDAAALAPYVGSYRMPQGRVIRVQEQGGRLQVQSGMFPRYTVYPVPGQPDRFGYDTIRAQLQFERYPSGAVRSLVLHWQGEERAVRLD